MLLEGCEACVTAGASSMQQQYLLCDLISIEEEEVPDETPVANLGRKRKGYVAELLEIENAAANPTPKKETDAERRQRLNKLRPGDVPAFDKNANGNPHEWNHGRNCNQWLSEGRRKKFLHEARWLRSTLEKSFERMKTFLTIREDDAGTSILKKVMISDDARISKNQWRLPWREFEDKGGEGALCPYSNGPYAKNGKSEWVKAYHGCKMESLYSIMMHGKISATKDPARARTKDKSPAVYCHQEKTKNKVLNYARLVPMFKDGILWSAFWELWVDRSQQFDLTRATSTSTRDQWAQREESVRLAALWLVAYSVEEVPANSHVIECWDPLVEGNPCHSKFEENASDADDGKSAVAGSGFLAN